MVTEAMEIKERLLAINQEELSQQISGNGYALLKNILNAGECDELIKLYNQDELYRKTINMERYRFGSGEYKYFSYPLPDVIQTIRETMYPLLAPISNRWMDVLKIGNRFPYSFDELQKICVANQQNKPTVLILKYG